MKTSLKTELIKLAGLRVVTTNLALQLLSIQAKLSAGCRKCRYIFTSEADKEHHMQQIYSGARVREEEGSTSQSKKSQSDIKCPVYGKI